MALGDVGGAVTTLIITCVAGCDGIKKGHPLALVGDYTVAKRGPVEIFGQALADAEFGCPLPVKVRGVCIFQYDVQYLRPTAGCGLGVEISRTHSEFVCTTPNADNRILKVDPENNEVHVLL